MTDSPTWIFVDDDVAAASSFAERLGEGESGLPVRVRTPTEAREDLLGTPGRSKVAPAGVLMDVDFSADQLERGTGPGMAQDLRIRQKSEQIAEFPIVRFSRKDVVEQIVQGDPASDDLFDLRIQKEELTRDASVVQRKLIGLTSVYRHLEEFDPSEKGSLGRLLGIDIDRQMQWLDRQFVSRLCDGRVVAIHVAAASFVSTFLATTGLLVDSTVLALRLGVDHRRMGTEWDEFARGLCFRYQGAGHHEFSRWWARGIEEWWFGFLDDTTPLSALTIEERIDKLKSITESIDFVPLTMPEDSPGERPWRLCAFGLEDEPAQEIPVDPREAIRLTPRTDLPVWVDLPYVSLGRAVEKKDDYRLSRSDLERLLRRYA